MTALTLVTGLLAGSYPALILSGFKPIQVLKGPFKISGSSVLFRKGLVVFQFVLSIVLIIGTIIVARQVNYVQQTNLGFDRDHLVYIPMEGDMGKQYSLFRKQALQTAGVKEVSCLSDGLTYIGGNATWSVSWSGKAAGARPMFHITTAGYDLVRTMNLQLRQGRDFSRDFRGDTSAYLVNEAALAVIGYKDPIGKPLEVWGAKGVIVGVLKDFHLTSLHETIHKLIVRLNAKEDYGFILMRTEPGSTKPVLAGLKQLCTSLNPKFSFTCHFADEEFHKLYKSEEIVGVLSNCFAVLAIFISCMGLLGLAMFTAERRTKEIGIRKILGAGLLSLLALLSGEFLLLIAIALLIASPLSWWAMHTWLQDYAYRTPIEWWIFALAGALAILIALLTISFQALKAAFANPVRSLRAE